jgi:hypothetical protein
MDTVDMLINSTAGPTEKVQLPELYMAETFSQPLDFKED